MQKILRTLAALGSGVVLAAGLSACGSIADVAQPTTGPSTGANGSFPVDWHSSTFKKAEVTKDGDTVKIDVGGGQTVTQNPKDPLKIAFVIQGTTNSYAQANITGAKARAQELGAQVTVFDGGFNAQTQYSQIQNVLNSRKYNAIMGLIVDGSSACNILTQQAPADDLLVAIIIQPICGRDTKAGQELWAPGTLTTVAGGGTLEFYQAWADKIASSVRKPTQAVYVTGPEGLSPVVAATKALKDASKKYPNFQLVDVQYTDYSSAQALAATQNALIAHPGVTMFVSHFTPLSVGIQQALAQNGKQGSVKIYDLGGDKTAKEMVTAGTIEQTVPYFPSTAAACAVDMLAAAHSGVKVPTVVLNDCRPTKGGNGTQTDIFIDKSNVASFHPEY
jgi:ribose transport system substrate-binding protein